jgi:ppGpp synthetase/RelA/SpoT-type nucleotidyltranferase
MNGKLPKTAGRPYDSLRLISGPETLPVAKKTDPPKAVAAPAAPPRNPTDDYWYDSPDLIRRFIEQRPAYEQLCSEIAYTLEVELKRAGIKYAAVTSRAKELQSFLEKIKRKAYVDPFAQTDDFAGVRVVCFFHDDLPKIEKVIHDWFNVVEWEDKAKALEVDRFGYVDQKALVHLTERTSGPRYDDLKDKRCEIQVRTVLQDAWAHLLALHPLQARDGSPTTAQTPNRYSGRVS